MTFDDLTPAAPRPLRAPPSFRRPPDVLDILALRSRRRLWVSAALRAAGAALLSLLREGGRSLQLLLVLQLRLQSTHLCSQLLQLLLLLKSLSLLLLLLLQCRLQPCCPRLCCLLLLQPLELLTQRLTARLVLQAFLASALQFQQQACLPTLLLLLLLLFGMLLQLLLQ